MFPKLGYLPPPPPPPFPKLKASATLSFVSALETTFLLIFLFELYLRIRPCSHYDEQDYPDKYLLRFSSIDTVVFVSCVLCVCELFVYYYYYLFAMSLMYVKINVIIVSQENGINND